MMIIACLCLCNERVALLIYIFPQRSSNRFTEVKPLLPLHSFAYIKRNKS